VSAATADLDLHHSQMPAIPSDSKVFLTGRFSIRLRLLLRHDLYARLVGGTGYIGIWILKTLLEQGFTVRAAVRKEEKAAYLKEKFQNHADQLEFTIIEDLLAPGAFDEALKGILGVIHTASPVVLTQDAKMDPSELTKPAVDGTLALLNSAAKSPSVQRIVLTSSIVAIWEPKPSPAVYTEVSKLILYNRLMFEPVC
jgi:nucleoside-diphosphate-sugar epimerase